MIQLDPLFISAHTTCEHLLAMNPLLPCLERIGRPQKGMPSSQSCSARFAGLHFAALHLKITRFPDARSRGQHVPEQIGFGVMSYAAVQAPEQALAPHPVDELAAQRI